eukprot:4198166-Pyramimonas_sp.AAC.1
MNMLFPLLRLAPIDRDPSPACVMPGVAKGGGERDATAESICPEREPIARRWRAYARSGGQSREGGEHMPGAGANRTSVSITSVVLNRSTGIANAARIRMQRP